MNVSVHPEKMFWVRAAWAIGAFAYAISVDGIIGWLDFLTAFWLASEHVRDCRRLAEMRRFAERHARTIIAYAGSKP